MSCSILIVIHGPELSALVGTPAISLTMISCCLEGLAQACDEIEGEDGREQHQMWFQSQPCQQIWAKRGCRTCPLHYLLENYFVSRHNETPGPDEAFSSSNIQEKRAGMYTPGLNVTIQSVCSTHSLMYCFVSSAGKYLPQNWIVDIQHQRRE